MLPLGVCSNLPAPWLRSKTALVMNKWISNPASAPPSQYTGFAYITAAVAVARVERYTFCESRGLLQQQHHRRKGSIANATKRTTRESSSVRNQRGDVAKAKMLSILLQLTSAFSILNSLLLLLYSAVCAFIKLGHIPFLCE
jgi:hypothetical protein